MAESVCFPKNIFKKNFGIGIDIGGSCCKFAYTTEEGDNLRFHFAIFTKERYLEAFEFIKKICGDRYPIGAKVTTCGITANMLNTKMKEILQITPNNISEIELMAKTFVFMYKNLPWESCIREPSPHAVTEGLKRAKRCQEVYQGFAQASSKMFLLETIQAEVPETLEPPPRDITFPVFLNVAGSAAFPLVVKEDGSVSFHTWNPFCGKVFCGLGGHIAGNKDFNDLCAMAEAGNRHEIDEVVSEIGGDSSDDTYACFAADDIRKDIIGHNFGKLLHKTKDQVKKEDVISALLLNNISSMVREFCLWAAVLKVKQVFFCGSLADANEMIRDNITTSYVYETYGHGCGYKSHHYFVRHGSYLAAIGALLMNLELVDSDLI